jgi:putative component of toxin-antitoxin plasmid stabilization module
MPRAARVEGKLQVFVSAVNSVETGDETGVRSGCREMGWAVGLAVYFKNETSVAHFAPGASLGRHF